ncbi:hypothetical protein GLOIN_2v1770262 [Rhizophagus irregularis DAOM 181602=DAOM 197198]|nr:hypothetical protein GLOIN_2v1770262 [Rhizophagus irregularis DAOM 181602=DAOM 197198]
MRTSNNTNITHNVKPRQFLGVDNEDEIEVILIDHEGHFLYKIIDGNKLLCPIIDFNLPQKVYNSIESKLKDKKIQDLLISAITKVYLEIFPKWDPETITIASNSDVKKISCHISTTGMRLKNIAQVVIFTELIYKKLSVSLQENKPEIRRCNDTNNKITEAKLKLKLVEKLLQKASIEVFDLSYLSETFSDIFSLKRIVPSYCSLCERKHTNENAYIIQYKKFYSYYCYCANRSGKAIRQKKAFNKACF